MDVTQSLAATPAWFPQIFDPDSDRVMLLRRSEGEYKAASFLDERSVRPEAERRIVEWAAIADAIPADARRDAQYIFHIGHVGSTLISRLLDELDSVFALREPPILRLFAELLGPVKASPEWSENEARRRIDVLTALLSRTFRPEQRALVKATSFTSEIADRLVPPGSRALFLFATPRNYIENILAGPNSVRELQALTPFRLERLRGRSVRLPEGEAMTDARRAALGWACEMTSLVRGAGALPAAGVMWMDFDRFLADPAGNLSALARFFGHGLDPATAAAIVAGPLMRRYSKALDYEYSPALRRAVLDEARRMRGPEIDDALAWLARAGEADPAVAEAMNRAA